MSYTPTEWKNGDIITAEKMNKIQEGIENLPVSEEFIINYFNDNTLDKTYDEIVTAIKSGLKPVIIYTEHDSDFPEYLSQNRYEYCYSFIGSPSSSVSSHVNGISFINFIPSLSYINGEFISSIEVMVIVIDENNKIHFLNTMFDNVIHGA